MKEKIHLVQPKVLIKRLLTYVKPYRTLFILGLLGTIGYACIDAGFTYMVKPLMDEGFIQKNMFYIKWTPLGVLIAFSLRGGFNFISTYYLTYVARNVVMELRQQIFSHLLKLPAKTYDNSTTGHFLSKLIYDVEMISEVSSQALTRFLQALFFVVGLLVVMFVVSWKLTCVYVLTVPLIATIVTITNKNTRRKGLAIQASMADLTNVAEESIEGYREVRIFGGQEYESKKFYRANAKCRDSDIKLAIAKAINVSGVQLVAASGISLILFLAINPAFSTILSAGGFVSMIVAMLAILKPLKDLTTVNSMIQKGLAGAQTVFEFFDIPLEQETGQSEIPKVKGQVDFENVSFDYGTGKNVLQNVSFSILPSQTLALVGRSGSGKTTLAALLARFYELEHGNIKVDGYDISQLKLTDLRKHLALVSQHVTLFNDTVANNIAYGCGDSVSRKAIEAAANDAYAMQFITQLPQGLDTLIGENGVLLSGGQRQRIAIARALLKDAPILILDEATSALDTESERYIQAALERVMKNRTTLIIAHRLSTIEKADQIVVLDQGQIVEVGSHKDLLQNNGPYAKLHCMQFETVILPDEAVIEQAAFA